MNRRIAYKIIDQAIAGRKPNRERLRRALRVARRDIRRGRLSPYFQQLRLMLSEFGRAVSDFVTKLTEGLTPAIRAIGEWYEGLTDEERAAIEAADAV